MLRASAGRWLLAAKTSVKEPVKAAKAKASKAVKVKRTVDLSKFVQNRWLGNNLVQIINALPKPEKPELADSATWLHKNGYGLKFYQQEWSRYPEPCYWTVARFKPRSKTHNAKVWGFKTWRGVTEPVPREIAGTFKREWRILIEPGTKLGPSQSDFWEAPKITAESMPCNSTQLPEGLKGTQDGSWPYPWGKHGLKVRLGNLASANLINAPADADVTPAADATPKSS